MIASAASRAWAQIPHHVPGERRIGRHDKRRLAAALEAVGHHARHDAHALGVEFLEGEDHANPGSRPRSRNVEPGDDPVRIGRAQHVALQRAVDLDVVGVAALAAQQHRILATRHRLADRVALKLVVMGSRHHALP